MANDVRFRNRLKELLEEDADDKEIVEHVLNHAWNSWPHSFHVWLNGKVEHMGFFGGTRYTTESPDKHNKTDEGDDE